MINRFRLIAILSVAHLMLCVASTRAANISVSSAVFQASDTSINIQVMLENDSSSVLNLAAFSFELQVTPISPTRVEFDSGSQPNTLADTNYVFYGNSSATNTPLTPWAVKSTGGGVNNDFVFSDTTDDTFNVTLAAHSSKLLAKIRLLPGSGSAAPQPGDIFTLSFVPAGTSIVDQDLNTVPFTTGTGTLAVAVPEPSAYLLALTGSAVMRLLTRRRQPKQAV